MIESHGDPFRGSLETAMSGSSMMVAAKLIVRELTRHGFTNADQPDRQALALSEETGEFIGAYRRWRGLARRTDTLEHVIEELADVIITAYVTAAEHGWDIDSAIDAKLETIMTRGWRE